MNIEFARAVVKELLAFDVEIGRLMELARDMKDAKQRACMKEACGNLLRLQFELIERFARAYPELRHEIDQM